MECRHRYDGGRIRGRKLTIAKILEPLGLFPLTGAMVLPGTFLPLNVFEERYLNLVSDALASGRPIGMVQPKTPAPDNFAPVADSAARPELYSVGGLGEISDWQREEDGRYLIVLEGVGRFDIAEELGLHRGYRRARARIRAEEDSAEDGVADVGDQLLPAALEFSREREIAVDEDVLASLPHWRLVNVLAVALPFEPAERQLLLEVDGLRRRGEVLVELLRMASASAPARRSEPGEPPPFRSSGGPN